MAFENSTHASLLERIRSTSDDDAWQDFFHRYIDLIRAVARRQGMQPVDADDVAQEVLIAVHRAIKEHRYDPNKGRFRGYLKTITLRATWKRQRKKNPIEPDTMNLDQGHAPELEDLWDAEWRQYHLRLAMNTIRVEFQSAEVEVFEMLTAQGRPNADVAKETGWSLQRIYHIKSRILARLRTLIREQVDEEG